MASAHQDQNGRAKTTRIVVVDDHPMVRERLGELINHEHDLMVCGEAESHQQALKVIAATRPNLAIVDLRLKGSSGLDLIKDIQARDPHLPVLVVSMHDEAVYAERVLRAGARGYITKQEATRNILAAIRKILAGEIFVSGPIAQKVLSQVSSHPQAEVRTAVDHLSDRELEVLELLGQGFSTGQIAATIRVEVKTIETYRHRLREKLDLPDANALLQYAIRWVHSGR